jgi:ferredoxin
MLNQMCPDLLSRDVFVCGPDNFMKNAQQQLTELGLAPEQYDQESFVIGGDQSQETAESSKSSYKVNFVESGIEVEVDSEQTILEAAEAAGIYPDYSCLAGVCGSCNSQLLAGDIHAPDARALDDEDKANGEFLPCCSYARSDLQVDL